MNLCFCNVCLAHDPEKKHYFVKYCESLLDRATDKEARDIGIEIMLYHGIAIDGLKEK
jgi:hypothetical protein